MTWSISRPFESRLRWPGLSVSASPSAMITQGIGLISREPSDIDNSNMMPVRSSHEYSFPLYLLSVESSNPRPSYEYPDVILRVLLPSQFMDACVRKSEQCLRWNKIQSCAITCRGFCRVFGIGNKCQGAFLQIRDPIVSLCTFNLWMIVHVSHGKYSELFLSSGRIWLRLVYGTWVLEPWPC